MLTGAGREKMYTGDVQMGTLEETECPDIRLISRPATTNYTANFLVGKLIKSMEEKAPGRVFGVFGFLYYSSK